MRAKITVRQAVAAALAVPVIALVGASAADAAPQTTASAVHQSVQGGGGGFGPYAPIGGYGIYGGYGLYGGYGYYGGFAPTYVPIGGFGTFYPYFRPLG
ncbi:hypothetical protein [Streptomyces sp. NPDC026673]|uniref:hypothetical protein n=1 Tax=Streptomyces sp. NPDC026673 TaxID=3155724 RepID=UPI0033D2C695